MSKVMFSDATRVKLVSSMVEVSDILSMLELFIKMGSVARSSEIMDSSLPETSVCVSVSMLSVPLFLGAFDEKLAGFTLLIFPVEFSPIISVLETSTPFGLELTVFPTMGVIVDISIFILSESSVSTYFEVG